MNWHDYERIVAAFESQNHGIEMSITPNAKIMGSISGVKRQIDVLIDARWDDDTSKRIIVDAKYYKRPLNVKDIENFEGMMRDLKASRGIIYCPKGYSPAAARRAQDAITITILSDKDINIDWWAAFSKCQGQCIDSKATFENGLVLWDAQHALPLNGAYSVIFTGKCDTCHDYNVWCWACGERFGLSEQKSYQCSCNHNWANVVGEDNGNDILYLILIPNGTPPILSLDRRKLT